MLLELAMALETVDRSDDARKIYGKLASSNWSQKIRRNALQLMSGLDIVKQIRKDVTPLKPAMDSENMKLISLALEKGLTNEWNDFKKDKQYNKDSQFRPWFDNEDGKLEKIVNVNTLSEAYNLLVRELSPLKKLSSELLQKSFRRLYLTSDSEKVEFSKSKRKQNLARSSSAPTSFVAYRDENSRSVPMFETVTYSYNETKHFVNGSWDLLSSLLDASPYSAKRFDLGAVRRTIDVERMSCQEVFPVFWGLASTEFSYDFKWNGALNEVTLAGNALKNSRSPWQKGSQKKQTFQVEK